MDTFEELFYKQYQNIYTPSDIILAGVTTHCQLEASGKESVKIELNDCIAYGPLSSFGI